MSRTLSEADSKALLAPYGVPVVREERASSAEAAAESADRLGYPVVAKLCGPTIAHKTERGLVRLGLTGPDAVRRAGDELLGAAEPSDGEVELLVCQMVAGTRELIAGLSTDPSFGQIVMVGIGGVLAEAVGDVAFRMVPIDRVDAAEMIDDLELQAMLGPFRGEPPVDRAAVAEVLLALSEVASDLAPTSVDLNPLVVVDGRPVAVDALVEVAE